MWFISSPVANSSPQQHLWTFCSSRILVPLFSTVYWERLGGKERVSRSFHCCHWKWLPAERTDTGLTRGLCGLSQIWSEPVWWIKVNYGARPDSEQPGIWATAPPNSWNTTCVSVAETVEAGPPRSKCESLENSDFVECKCVSHLIWT